MRGAKLGSPWVQMLALTGWPTQGLAKMCLAAEPSERPTAKALQRALHKFALEEKQRLERVSSSSAAASIPSQSPRIPATSPLTAQQQPQQLPQQQRSPLRPGGPAAGLVGAEPAAPAAAAGGLRARLQLLCCCRAPPAAA